MPSNKESRWVIVLRNTETGKSFIWRSDQSAVALLNSAHKFFKNILSNHDWSKEADDLIRKRYPIDKAGPLVEPVSALLGRRVSPNSIRGRYWRIMKVSPDEIQYNSPGSGEEPHLILTGPPNARSN